jgi:hypothetical protein
MVALDSPRRTALDVVSLSAESDVSASLTRSALEAVEDAPVITSDATNCTRFPVAVVVASASPVASPSATRVPSADVARLAETIDEPNLTRFATTFVVEDTFAWAESWRIRSALVTTPDDVSTIDSTNATRSLAADTLADPVIVCDALVRTAIAEIEGDALELIEADDSLKRIADAVTVDWASRGSADAPSRTTKLTSMLADALAFADASATLTPLIDADELQESDANPFCILSQLEDKEELADSDADANWTRLAVDEIDD